MRRLLQRLLLPLAMVAVTQTSIVSAESIRLKGPNGEIQSSPQFSESVSNGLRSAEPSLFYGPTTGQETLWGIATQLRPNTSVSIQQTLYSIFQLNPQAFDNQNIHELIPGSTLRVPSLAQIQGVSTQQAVNVMAAHKARLEQVTKNSTPTAVQPSAPKAPVTEASTSTQPKTEAAVETKPETPLEQIAQQEKTAQVNTLERQLESSEGELMALEEKNHKLRLMLAQVQSEVDVLKDELGDEERIRNEVEKLLEAERMRVAEEQKMAPSSLDKFFSNTWLVAALAIIPGLLIGLLVVMLLGRRNKQEESAPEAQQETPQPQTVAPVAAETMNEDIDDDLLLDDDLFGDSNDDEALFGDEGELGKSDEDDVFADLDDSDLDFNLEGEDGDDPFAGIGDDGDLDESLTDGDMGSSGISVNSDDKALGLEEMERALDEVVIDDGDDEGFDLSDEGDMSQEALDSLLAEDGEAEELEGGSLDQSMLDDLFSEIEDDGNESLDFDNLLDEGDDFDLSDEDETSLEEPSLASDSEIDDIFAQMEAQADLETLEANSIDETALLDEMLEEETTAIDENSTDLLDELLADNVEEPEQQASELEGEDLFDELIGLNDDESAIDTESTDLLDELVDESEESDEFNLDSELDELIGADAVSEESSSLDDSTDLLDELFDSADEEESLGDEGTDLFEELLEIEKQNLQDDAQPEPEADITEASQPQELEEQPLAEEVPAEQDQELSAEDNLLDNEQLEPEASDESLDESDIASLLDETAQIDSEADSENSLEPLNEEPQTLETSADFSSQDFMDDMLSVAPEADPLLDELDLDDLVDTQPTSELDDISVDLSDDVQTLAEPEPEP
ncbi:FimV/HubP family polar landmark protein, partial [Vibrio sinaloensis]